MVGVSVLLKLSVQSATSSVAYEVGIENKLVEVDCFFDKAGNLLSRARDGTPLEQEPKM